MPAGLRGRSLNPPENPEKKGEYWGASEVVPKTYSTATVITRDLHVQVYNV